MGQLDNTIVVFTTDNGAETVSFPDGGITPFKGQKGEAWEGGYRSPCVVRWPGHIKPGTVKKELFAALDWVPTFVDIAGGPKGDDLNKQIQAGKYPGIVKTMLDGFDQRAYLEGTDEHSARDVFFYYSGATPSAVRYKNWKMYYSMAPGGASGWFLPLVNYHWTLVGNIKRDPFEQTISFSDSKSAMALGGTLAAPSYRLPVRLEHAAHRPVVVDEGTLVLQGVPAAAGAGDLQPGWHPEANGEATRATTSSFKVNAVSGGLERVRTTKIEGEEGSTSFLALVSFSHLEVTSVFSCVRGGQGR